MNVPLLKALIALLPACMLLLGSAALFSRQKTLWCLLQLLGAGCLVVVALTHVCEALQWFPWMQWGRENSAGHYVDLLSAALALTLFPTGYLLQALIEEDS